VTNNRRSSAEIVSLKRVNCYAHVGRHDRDIALTLLFEPVAFGRPRRSLLSTQLFRNPLYCANWFYSSGVLRSVAPPHRCTLSVAAMMVVVVVVVERTD